MPGCAMVSFRLGLADGVSVVADHWARALERLGFVVTTVAGEGPVDRLVPGLAIDATAPPEPEELATSVGDADLVVVENLLSIPLNLPASRTLAEVLRGRPTICHHHDPPWQRDRFAHVDELPIDDPNWRHVTINRLTESQFVERGIDATTIYNGFDTDPPRGRRRATRSRLGIDNTAFLVAHPVRAIERKNVPQALSVTAHLGGVYWIPGQAEEGYGPTLDRILARASCPVRRHPVDGLDITMADLYAACDLVVFPSTWEGFGNPPIEAALVGKPVAVAHYPVADELRRLGFRWPDTAEPEGIKRALESADLTEDLETNRALALEHFSLEAMSAGIERLLDRAGWLP